MISVRILTGNIVESDHSPRRRGTICGATMPKGKIDFPVAKVRRYLDPGPIVLVSSAWKGETNIMTMGWHTVMEFEPSLIGCMISSAACAPHPPEVRTSPWASAPPRDAHFFSSVSVAVTTYAHLPPCNNPSERLH